METPSQRAEDVRGELSRRRKAALLTIGAMSVLTVALSLIAFFGKNLFRHQSSAAFDLPFKISVLALGIGSVVLRRASYSSMRLKDVAALKGAFGVLRTLWMTTVQVACLGAAISLFGFITTAATADTSYAYRAGLVGLLVLLYHYPTRTSWQRALDRFVTLGPESQKLHPVQPAD